MREAKLRGAGMLAMMVVAAMGVRAAHAEVITLDVSGTLTPDTAPAACSPTCTLGGDIVINNSTGAIISEDVAASGFSPSVGPFSINAGIGTIVGVFNMFTIIFINDADADVLNLAVSTPTLGSLIGYDGGSLAALGFPVASGVTGSDAKGAWDLTSGSLTPAVPAVPEPPSTLVLLTALGAFAVLLGTRLVARRTAPC